MDPVAESAPIGGFALVLQNPYLCGVASVRPCSILDNMVGH